MHVVHGPAVRCEKETQILKCQPNKIYLNPSGLSPDPVSTVLLHQGNVEPPQHLRAKFPFLPRVYFELLPVKHVLYCVLPNVFFFFFSGKEREILLHLAFQCVSGGGETTPLESFRS